MDGLLRKRIKVDDLEVSYLDLGALDGDALLILHGFPEESSCWHEVGDFLVSLGFRVIIPDQRGFAATIGNSQISACRFDLLAHDMLHFLDALKLSSVTLVGHDWGGAISWYLIERYPSRFKRALIANAPHWRAFRRFLFTHPIQLFKSWYMLFIQLPVLPEWLLSLGNFGLLGYLIRNSSVQKLYPHNKLEVLKLHWRERMKGMLNWYRAIILFSDFKPHSKIEVPVYVVWGRKEPFLSPGLSYASAKECNNSEVIILDQTGHWPHYEEPEKFKDILKKLK